VLRSSGLIVVRFHGGCLDGKVVRFHGGFLDGKLARGGDPPTGDILDDWTAQRFYATTAGIVGAFISGVSDNDPEAMRHPSESATLIDHNHQYRVIAAKTDDGELTLDASYESANVDSLTETSPATQ
jgi:hypothetical protein